MISDKIKAFIRWFSTVDVCLLLAAKIIIALVWLIVVALLLLGFFKFRIGKAQTTTPSATVPTPTAITSISNATVPTFTQLVLKADSKAANKELQTKIAQTLANEQMKTLRVASSAQRNAKHVNVSVNKTQTTVTTTTKVTVLRLDLDNAFLANPTINESTVKAIKKRYRKSYEEIANKTWSPDKLQEFLKKRNITKVTVWKRHTGFKTTLHIELDAKQEVYNNDIVRIHRTKRWSDGQVDEVIFNLRNATVYAYIHKEFYSFYDCENFLFGSSNGTELFPSYDVDNATTMLASFKANEKFVEMTQFDQLSDHKGQILLGRDNKTKKLTCNLSTRSWTNLFNHLKSVRFSNSYGFLRIEDGLKVGVMSAFNSQFNVIQNRTVALMSDKRYNYTYKPMNASEMAIKIPWTPNELCAIEPHEKTDTVILYETRESKYSYLRLLSDSYSEEIEFFPSRKIIRIEKPNLHKMIYDGAKNDAVSVTIGEAGMDELRVNRSASTMGCYEDNSLLEISQHTIVIKKNGYEIVLNGGTISFQKDNDVEQCVIEISLDELKNKEYVWRKDCENEEGTVRISERSLDASYVYARLMLIYASGSIIINAQAIVSGDKLALHCDSGRVVMRFRSAMSPLNIWSARATTEKPLEKKKILINAQAIVSDDKLVLHYDSGRAVMRFRSAMSPLNIWNARATAEEPLKVEKEEPKRVDFSPILTEYINSLGSNELLRMHSDWVNISMNATNTQISSILSVISLKRARYKPALNKIASRKTFWRVKNSFR